LGLNHDHLINGDYLAMLQWTANVNKILRHIRIKPTIQLW